MLPVVEVKEEPTGFAAIIASLNERPRGFRPFGTGTDDEASTTPCARPLNQQGAQMYSRLGRSSVDPHVS